MATLGPIHSVTIATTDLAASVAAYEAGFGFVTIERADLAADVAEVALAPALDGASTAWLVPAPEAAATRQGGIRLIEVPGPLPDAAPLRSLGWAAAEFSVQDPDALVPRLEEAGFTLLGEPRPLGSNRAIRACQMAGPNGEGLYLTDVRAYAGALALHKARVPVDRCFIAVLATDALEDTRAVYEARPGASRVSDREVEVPVLRARLGLADGVTTRISSVAIGGDCLVEIDAYPTGTPARAMAAGRLPAGIGLVRFAGASRGLTAAPTQGARGEWLARAA